MLERPKCQICLKDLQIETRLLQCDLELAERIGLGIRSDAQQNPTLLRTDEEASRMKASA